MKKKMNRNQKSLIVIALCSIVIIMAVGYAAFSTGLNINGTTTVSSNWDIKITDITPTAVTGSATNTVAPSYTDTTATFSTSLASPGDSITYKVTISNEGSIAAKLNKITLTDPKNSAILFTTTGLSENDVLGASSTATLNVKVEYNPAITGQPESLTSTLKVVLDYVQNQ